MTRRAAWLGVVLFWLVVVALGSGCAPATRAWYGCDRDVQVTAWRGFEADMECQRMARRQRYD
jgi:hypothetical protein